MKAAGVIYLVLLFFSVQAFGQIELSRQVIGSFGGSVILGNDVNVAFTLGEPVVSTISNGSTILTQGFHQPKSMNPLSFELAVNATSCEYSTDGGAEVKEIKGCFGPYTIVWSNGIRGTFLPDLGPGLYSVTVSTPDCAISESFEIIAGSNSNCNIRFFNAFSPNNDGINDTWEIENIEEELFTENTVEVFNRWGQEVYRAANYDNRSVVWKGDLKNGEVLPDGTYFYVVTIREDIYKGFIELTR